MQTARGKYFISRCIMIMIIVMIAYGAYTLQSDVNKPRPVVVRAGQATLQAGALRKQLSSDIRV